jgi:hypothetical protein
MEQDKNNAHCYREGAARFRRSAENATGEIIRQQLFEVARRYAQLANNGRSMVGRWLERDSADHDRT